jgi:hypothetical protein
MTVQDDILYPALRLARIVGGPGRTASASQVTDAFQALNRLLDSWSTLRGMIYSIQRNVYTLTPPQEMYSIGRGPGADFVADRPQRINDANAVIQTGGSAIYHPIRILSVSEWAEVRYRTFLINWPTAIYPTFDSPNCEIWMLGIPTGSPGLELWTWQLARQFQAEAETFTAPPGYLEAMVYNLAVKLGDIFGTAGAMSPNVFSDARKTMARVAGLNLPSPPVASADIGTGAGGNKGDFNYFSGGPA